MCAKTPQLRSLRRCSARQSHCARGNELLWSPLAGLRLLGSPLAGLLLLGSSLAGLQLRGPLASPGLRHLQLLLGHALPHRQRSCVSECGFHHS